MALLKLKQETKELQDLKQQRIHERFFKTGPGEYGAGDVFYGIKVPILHKIAIKYKDLPLRQTEILLHDKIHEHRMTALFILILKYQTGEARLKQQIYQLYLKNYKYINNWDLVDISCIKIVGDYLLNKPKEILYKLAKSKNLWQRRVAIISTFAFIREKQYQDTLNLAKILLKDKHDLIHKAVGWMLREVGKRDKQTEVKFLDKYASQMPRVMLRYAVEKFSQNERKKYYRL